MTAVRFVKKYSTGSRLPVSSGGLQTSWFVFILESTDHSTEDESTTQYKVHMTKHNNKEIIRFDA